MFFVFHIFCCFYTVCKDIINSMSPNLFFNNKKYISAKEASFLTNYSKDYIGQLARGNKIDSKRIGRMWYVEKESLLNYKNFSNKLGLLPELGPEVNNLSKEILNPEIPLVKKINSLETPLKTHIGSKRKILLIGSKLVVFTF